MDPEEAAEFATEGETVSEPQGPEISDSGGNGILESMLNTEPSRPLESVESPWDPRRGGLNRVMRGLQKATGHEGLPAILDIGIGIVEFYISEMENGAGNAPEDNQEENQFEEI